MLLGRLGKAHASGMDGNLGQAGIEPAGARDGVRNYTPPMY